MPLSSPKRLIEVLRATLLEVEETSGVPADDPSMAKLKSILVRRIADLEAERVVEEAAGTSPESSSDTAMEMPATEKMPDDLLPSPDELK